MRFWKQGHEMAEYAIKDPRFPEKRLTSVQGVLVPCAFFDDKPIFAVSSDELKELPAAFVTAQGAFERAKKDKDNPFFKSVYADLSSVLDACADALTKNGFALVQPIVTVNGEAYLLTRLLHKSGEWLQSSVPLTTLDAIKTMAAEAPIPTALGAGGDEGKKKKTPGVQALGSEITYMRRYCLSSLLGIAADDDDDGNATNAVQQQHQKPAPSKGLGGLAR